MKHAADTQMQLLVDIAVVAGSTPNPKSGSGGLLVAASLAADMDLLGAQPGMTLSVSLFEPSGIRPGRHRGDDAGELVVAALELVVAALIERNPAKAGGGPTGAHH